jgi:hypothetical protein
MIPHPEVLARASFPDVLDSSILASSVCPLKCFYQYFLSLSPSSKSVHLHAGGAFAKSIETVRKDFYLKGLPLDSALYNGYRALIDYWGTYDDVPLEGTGSYKDFINIAAALFDYFRNYDPATDHIQPYKKHDGSPAVEFTFSLPLPINHPESGNPLLYAGRCDMIGVYQSNVCVVDEKTSYTFMPNWADSFSMRGQFLGYTWAARSFGIPATMCVVRGVAIQQKSIKHLEAILQYPNWQIERWYVEMLRKVQMLVDCWNKKTWPMSYGDACSAYGGCSMMDLCKSPNPEIWLDSFTVRKWNPLDVGQVKEASGSA